MLIRTPSASSGTGTTFESERRRVIQYSGWRRPHGEHEILSLSLRSGFGWSQNAATIVPTLSSGTSFVCSPVSMFLRVPVSAFSMMRA